MVNEETKINFCKAFLEKVAGKQGIENKTRYLLEDFFYKEGWSSMTNPKAMKEGHSQQFTYNKSTITHFIEDFVRLFNREWELEWQKLIKEASQNEKPK